jgi:hypothetical protein
VTADFNQCPDNAEEVAEAYVMGTLTAEQAIAFEIHYVGCNRCALVLQKAVEYVDAMRAAAKKVRDEPES